jgi:hypothetical protein
MAMFNVPDTPEMKYVKAYNACIDVLIKAGVKFDVIAHDASAQVMRDKARARSLDMDRELQLAKDRHSAWLDGTGPAISAPDADKVARAKELAEEVSTILAQEQEFSALVDTATEAIDMLHQMHA